MNVLLFWLNWLTCGYPWQTTIFHRQMNEDPFFLSANVPQRYFCEIRYYLQFTFIYLLLVFVYNVHLLFSCNHWYLHLPDSPTISLCAFDNMLSQSLLTTCCLALFSRLKNVNKAQCPQDFYTKPFQQGTTPSIGTHGVYQMSRLHYVTSASF